MQLENLAKHLLILFTNSFESIFFGFQAAGNLKQIKQQMESPCWFVLLQQKTLDI